MSGPHVFIDESMRGGTYYIAAAVFASDDLAPARKELRSLLLPGMRRLHMTEQKDGFKKTILTALRGTGLEARVYSCRAKLDVARPACLEAAVLEALAIGAERLVIENHSGARADRRLISHLVSAGRREALRYEHVDGFKDPLLWAADAVVWAFGAGGRWRSVVDPLISAHRLVEL